ncbi:uncharacterized protein PHALS_14078 [Plasmopara halstedii]|uniref:Uncharacterized protein n=1 Tax=Plasmopara halstedii TaxID=4781 RepID=A0A0P1AQE7_PLAHL|nr:uncharacterized protein PHALS_14078 [Plasmopara halstedii]CEG43786.1 hypothetical protein PHALS_14078 [Plasmopara halstedii]|eukprot:XP_024580155.1 hypothetical protein PHALS_14078 [Plasmopara halstedii]
MIVALSLDLSDPPINGRPLLRELFTAKDDTSLLTSTHFCNSASCLGTILSSMSVGLDARAEGVRSKCRDSILVILKTRKHVWFTKSRLFTSVSHKPDASSVPSAPYARVLTEANYGGEIISHAVQMTNLS